MSETDYETLTREKGAYLLARLRDLQRHYKIIGDVDGLGMALRIEVCGSDGYTPDKAMVDRLVEEGMKANLCVGSKRYGLVLDVGGYYKNVITLAPSLDISYAEMDLAVELLDQLFGRVSSRSRVWAATHQPVPQAS